MKRLAKNKQKNCWCAGYWFPHRKTGGACVHSSRADYYAAIRSGQTINQAMEFLSSLDLERMFPLKDESDSDTKRI